MEKYNLVDALLLNGASLGILLFFVRRWFLKIDETMKTIVGRDLCAERRDEIRADLHRLCEKNAKEHADLWKHKHATTGEVIIP